MGLILWPGNQFLNEKTNEQIKSLYRFSFLFVEKKNSE